MKKKFNYIATILIVTSLFSLLIGCENPTDDSIPDIIPEEIAAQMIVIPNSEIKMLKTEVTQEMYVRVMKVNPATSSKGNKIPVESVSWYDAIYFCNKLSEKASLTPVYSVNNETDVSKWNYEPHKENSITGTITQNLLASGYRLPTTEEWKYAAKGGEDYSYAGSNNLADVAWYFDNSDFKSHEVAQKKENAYGLYDMCGNVSEWCWEITEDRHGYLDAIAAGGSFATIDNCIIENPTTYRPHFIIGNNGFRIVCKNGESQVQPEVIPEITPEEIAAQMIVIPNSGIKMLKTEVTQEIYASVMRVNPAISSKGNKIPVESVSWYDAIYFCNKLSEKAGLTPVYSVNNETDTSKWSYIPHKGNYITGSITQDNTASGYRLPIVEEWKYAAKGGETYSYAGSNTIADVAWYLDNSNNKPHEVAQKKANAYGLYDMTGNVYEWCTDRNPAYICGGAWDSSIWNSYLSESTYKSPEITANNIGFRIVCISE